MSAPVDNRDDYLRVIPPHLRKKAQPLPTHLDFHPEVIRGAHISKDPNLLDAARAPLAAAQKMREQINKLLGTTVSRAELAKATTLRMQEVTRLFDRVVPGLEARKATLEKQINSLLAGTPDVAAGEIRNHFKSAEGPFAAAIAALNQGDVRTTQALLNAPAYLSGLTNDQHTQLRQQARAKLFPDQDGLIQDIDQALTVVKRSGEALVTDVAGALKGWQDNSVSTIQKVMGNG